jgi:hypothetical protein
MNDNNTHGAFIQFSDGSTAFVDGLPDKCQHDDEGAGYYFIGGDGFDELVPNTGQTQDELRTLDLHLRAFGKYISGGCVSCSKCGKPYELPMFDF